MTYFRAFTFAGKKTARQAFDEIEDDLYTYDWYFEDDVADISVSKNGHIRVHSTWAQDSSNTPEGIGLGGILGGLIGLLFGPGGAIAGAAIGGTVGGLIGHHENVKFDDPALDDFAATLLPDTSALIYIGDEDAVAAFEVALGAYDFTAFQAEVDQATIDAINAKIDS
jgi:uncharacterized membrane protein